MFFLQTFDWADLPRLFFLSFLEILLSADNVIVLGVIVSHLVPSLRSKALYIGTLSAFGFRLVALIFLSTLLAHPWIQLVGAAYLLYLSLRHFSKKKGEILTPIGGKSLWKTILLIEAFDLAFAIDSILAGVAFIGSNQTTALINPKLWIVYLGGMLGLIGIRYAAHLFTDLIEKFPRFHTSAYLIVGLIGLKLAYQTLPLSFLPLEGEPVFWALMLLFSLLGFYPKKRQNK